MESAGLLKRTRTNRFVLLIAFWAFVPAALAGCAPSASETATEKRKPQRAGQPINPCEMAENITAARASAAHGDTQAAEKHIKAIATGITRSARMPDVHRAIDHESARTAVRPIPGVRSSVWMDHENFIVMVAGASHRSMDMIDNVCLALEPLGDTLAIVVNVQDVTATTPDGATTLSRNCQLPEGQRAFMQRKREVDVVSNELRDNFKKQQGQE